MEILVGLLLPIVILFCGIGLLGRVILPGMVGSVFFGILLRDLFWLLMRGLGAILRLPFLAFALLMRNQARHRGWRERPPRRRRRHEYSSKSHRRRH
jgi:hypothetical protein